MRSRLPCGILFEDPHSHAVIILLRSACLRTCPGTQRLIRAAQRDQLETGYEARLPQEGRGSSGVGASRTLGAIRVEGSRRRPTRALRSFSSMGRQVLAREHLRARQVSLPVLRRPAALARSHVRPCDSAVARWSDRVDEPGDVLPDLQPEEGGKDPRRSRSRSSQEPGSSELARGIPDALRNDRSARLLAGLSLWGLDGLVWNSPGRARVRPEMMVPEVGIEPTWRQAPGDFESPASTSFTTPAHRNEGEPIVARQAFDCQGASPIHGPPFALDFE